MTPALRSTLRKLEGGLKATALGGASHLRNLTRGISFFQKNWKPKPSETKAFLKWVQPGQPFDLLFLMANPLFLKSRRMFLSQGGKFEPVLVTSPRSLGSPILLENRIQYSPIEDELFWTAKQIEGERGAAKKSLEEGLSRLITYVTSTFHEQNHRILWKLLPKPKDLSEEGIRRYLNFVEALVVSLDTALGDELGPQISSLGFLSGALYDPGTHVQFETERQRRSYLQAGLRATYLYLEFWRKEEIKAAMPGFFPELPKAAVNHAVDRALRLDERFVNITNPEWQAKNWRDVRETLRPQSKTEKTIDVSADPNQFIEPYVWVEKIYSVLLR